MSLFERLFLNKPDFEFSDSPVITLLYAKIPNVEFETAFARIKDFEPLSKDVRFFIEPANQSNLWFASVSFDDHKVDIAVLPSPLPTVVMEQCVYNSPWDSDFKALLESHISTVILLYAGESVDIIEKYLALYKVAGVLDTDGLLGVVNEPAYTCHPASKVRQILDPEILPMVRESPPLEFWTGFFRVSIGEEEWLLTRGNRLANKPDLAIELHDPSEIPQNIELLLGLSLYLITEQIEIQAGDAVNLDEETFYEFQTVDNALAAYQGNGSIFIVKPMIETDIDWDLYNSYSNN